MKKLVLGSMLTLGISGIMFGQAATQSETTTTDVNKGLFSKAGVVVNTATQNNNVGKKNYSNDVNTEIFSQVVYKLTDTDKVSLEWHGFLNTMDKTQSVKEGPLALKDDYIGFRYDRSSILTKADNGMDFSVSIRGNIKTSEGASAANESRSTFNPRAYLTYYATPSFSIENEGRLYVHDAYNRGKKFNGRLYVRPKYSVTDSFALIGEAYYDAAMGNKEHNGNYLRLRPGVEVAATDKLTAKLFSEHYFGSTYGDNDKGRPVTSYYAMRNNDMALYTNMAYAFSKNFDVALELSTLVMKDGKLGRNAPIGKYYVAEVDFNINTF